MATTDHQPFDYQVQPYSLVKMIPPRTGEKTLAATKNLLGSLSDEEHTLSLELVGSPKGVTLMHRSEGSDNLFRRLFFGHFPTARLDEIDPKDDPMVLRDDEEAWTCTMRVEGPPYVPLRIYNDQDIQADHGSDPMAAVVAAHANLGENERVISRLVLKPLARDWSERYKRMGLGGAGSHNQAQSIEEQREKSKSSPSSSSSDEGDSSLPIIGVIAVIAVAAVFGYQKFQDLTQVVQVLLGLSGALSHWPNRRHHSRRNLLLRDGGPVGPGHHRRGVVRRHRHRGRAQGRGHHGPPAHLRSPVDGVRVGMAHLPAAALVAGGPSGPGCAAGGAHLPASG